MPVIFKHFKVIQIAWSEILPLMMMEVKKSF